MKMTIYEMKLHDEINIDKYLRVLRVPGGWIYIQDTQMSEKGWSSTSSFVPYNNDDLIAGG